MNAPPDAPLPSRFVPTSFDPNDPTLSAVLAPDRPWASCERVFRRHGVRGAMSRLPLFWQAEIPLWQAARAAGAFIFLNEAKNMPVGRMALLHADINAIITDATDAETFANYLTDNNAPTGLVWLVIHPLSEVQQLPAALRQPGMSVYQEVHHTPCVPIFEQCDTLADAKKQAFHSVDDTSVSNFSTSFTAHGTCDCGKTIYVAS